MPGTATAMNLLVARREKCVFSEHDASEAVTFSEIATEFVVQSRSALMEDELCGEETEGLGENSGEEGEAEGEEEDA